MKYYGLTKDINGNDIEIVFVTHKDQSSTTELILSDNPIELKFMGEEGNIFKPIKYTSASINIITDTFIQDFVVDNITDISVTIKQGDNMVFVGYVEPTTYSQEYAYKYESYTLNCVDLLGALLYIDFKDVMIGSRPILRRGSELIANMFKYLSENHHYTDFKLQIAFGIYKMVVSSVETATPDNILQGLAINEKTFFDEDDQSVKCAEAIEIICQYIGATALCFGDNVYFTDYIYLIDNAEIFKTYIAPDFTTVSGATMINSKIEVDNKISGEDGNISIEQKYDKIRIVCDLYAPDNMLPALTDSNYSNTTKLAKRRLDDGQVKPWEFIYRHFYSPSDNNNGTGLYLGIKPNIFAFNQMIELDDFEYGCINTTFAGEDSTMEYNKPFIASIQDLDGNYPTHPTCIEEIGKYYGAMTHLYGSVDAIDYNIYNGGASDNKNKKLTYKNLPSLSQRLSFVSGSENQRFNNGEVTSGRGQIATNINPCIKLQSSGPVVLPDGCNICFDFEGEIYTSWGFNGSQSFFNESKKELTSIIEDIPKTYDNKTTKRMITCENEKKTRWNNGDPLDTYIEVYIYHRGLYFNNETNKWVVNPYACKIPVRIEFGATTTVKTLPNTTFLQVSNKECYSIYTKFDSYIEIGVKFPRWLNEEYTIDSLVSTGTYHAVYANICTFKKFDIWVENINVNVADDKTNTDDIVYERIIDTKNENKFDDLTLKLSTWDNSKSKPNFSTVCIMSPTINGLMKGFVNDINFYNGSSMKFEEHLLNKYYYNYKENALIYEVTINELTNPVNLYTSDYWLTNNNISQFLLDGYTYNVKYCKNNVKLRQLYNITEDSNENITKRSIQRQYYRTGLIYKANP